jgi:peptide/nickel transport system permease protein
MTSTSGQNPTQKLPASAVLAAVLLGLLVLLAVGADVIAAALGVSGTATDLGGRFADAQYPHLLGQNELGQDLLVRLLLGARVSLVVGFLAAVVSSVIGVAVGVVAAAFGGVVDTILMRVTDALLALPLLPLLLVASALDVGRPTTTTGAITRVVVLLSVFSWMTVARLARAQATTALGLDHVRAARALGAAEPRVLWRHVLPLTLPPVIVQATLEVGSNILAESALSFLGLGIQPPTASWGNMLMSALDVLKSDPPSAFLPGAAILVTVVCVQVVGDAIRDRL